MSNEQTPISNQAPVTNTVTKDPALEQVMQIEKQQKKNLMFLLTDKIAGTVSGPRLWSAPALDGEGNPKFDDIGKPIINHSHWMYVPLTDDLVEFEDPNIPGITPIEYAKGIIDKMKRLNDLGYKSFLRIPIKKRNLTTGMTETYICDLMSVSKKNNTLGFIVRDEAEAKFGEVMTNRIKIEDTNVVGAGVVNAQ